MCEAPDVTQAVGVYFHLRLDGLETARAGKKRRRQARGLPVWSQQQYPLRSITRTVVKSDRVADYEDLLKQSVAMAKKAGADRGIFVWRVAAGNTSEYWSVSQLAKYADRDQA
ncbi:MAG: hypothetical protein HYR60_29760, partial [Acidobacteria bacterium]|nr:hypothetical protein [Acidobacteriota bacterium]